MSSSPASNGFHQEPTMVKLPPLSPTTAENASAPPPPATSTTVNDPNQHPSQLPDPSSSSPRLSSTWDPDSLTTHCTSCRTPFDPLFHRRHHCRLCGRLFCQNCSNTRSLIPPSALVLKRASSSSGDDQSHFGGRSTAPSFAPRDDGDECLTYVRSPSQSHPNDDHDHRNDDTLLYGRGLERRILLARHPQRTCHPCRVRLAPLQEELCLRNSNAMRYNYIDEGDAVRRLCNSPLAFTLGHEVRKAAYALGNLLPGRKGGGDGGGGAGRLGAFLSADHRDDGGYDSYPPPQADPCYAPHGASCKTLDPTLRDLDGVHIPARLLRRAKGVAIVTAAKGGLGFAGFEFGTGLVVARRRGGNVHNDNSNNTNDNHSNDNHTSTNNHPHATNPIQHEEPSPDAWSAPSAIAIAGFAWGALLGAQVSDHVFLLMTDDALRLFSSDDGRSIHLGADVGVALGPLGRAAEADVGAAAGTVAPIYTYSLSKGLYAGISLDGRIVVSRPRVNEKFYGKAVTAKELLSGEVPSPPAAQPLYDALKRCRVYGGGDGSVANAEADGSYGGWSGGSPQENRTVDGGLLERWSHATGAGLPAVSHSSGRDGDVYNLSGRGEPAFMATNDPRYSS